MTQTVIGIFDSSTEAQNAVQKLSSNGFTIDQVDVTYDNNTSALQGTPSQENSLNQQGSVRRDNEEDGFGEKISRFFKSMFDDDEESTRYSSVARNAAIVTVIADSREEAERAAEILDDAGAVDVDERSQQYQSGATGSMSGASGTMTGSSESLTGASESLAGTSGSLGGANTYAADNNLTTENAYSSTDDTTASSTRDRNLTTDESGRSIPIIEEELQVGKREVDRGSVRLRSRIIERPVEESIRLREERVTVERNTVNRPVTEGELSSFREGEIEVTQRAEVPVVNKEARVVEEISLNKDVREREEVIRDTVRRTEVEIDDDTNLSTDDTLKSRKRTDDI
jgi:stress response protein YsnF